MYYELFTMLSDFIYGAEAVLTTDQNLVLTMMSTAGVLFVVGMPFLVVWRVIRVFL